MYIYIYIYIYAYIYIYWIMVKIQLIIQLNRNLNQLYNIIIITLYNNVRGVWEVISPISHLNSFKKI